MWFSGLYSYRQWVRFITLSPNNVFLLLLNVERVCKSFGKESWRVQVARLHNAARAPSSRIRCFQLSTNRFLSLSLMLWYKTNRMWLSVVCNLINNDTGHHGRQDLLWNHWFIHACRHNSHKQNFHGNLNGFLVTFSTIFTSYLWRVSFRTLWRVWYSSEWHFLSLN